MGPSIKAYRGNTKSFTVSVFTANHTPFPLDEHECKFVVSKTWSSHKKIIEKDILPDNVRENVMTINLTSSNLTTEIGNYYYEVIVSKDNSSFKKTVAQGILCILPSINMP